MHVLVYGFYDKGNLGDELFKLAFKKIFPAYTFRFVSEIRAEYLHGIDTVFFGGGSFVYAAPNIEVNALDALEMLPIFYVGVGIEQNNIHKVHRELMSKSEFCFIRNTDAIEKVSSINSNTKVIDDIVFSLRHNSKKISKPRSILFMPNAEVLPNNTSSHWVHASWEHFKTELSQTFDAFIDSGFTVRMLPFCKNDVLDDAWAASEVISRMKNRSPSLILPHANEQNVFDTASDYDCILSQRYHGAVIGKSVNRKTIAVCHHDKLRASPSDAFLNYYECSKGSIIDTIKNVKSHSLELTKFSEVFQTIDDILRSRFIT